MFEPMNPERLAEIQERYDAPHSPVECGKNCFLLAHQDVPVLLAEVKRLQKAVDLLGSHLQGGSQAFIDALAEASRLSAELDSIRARAVARNDQLLAARDACSYDDRARRRAYEQSAAELRSLVDGVVEE